MIRFLFPLLLVAEQGGGYGDQVSALGDPAMAGLGVLSVVVQDAGLVKSNVVAAYKKVKTPAEGSA